MMNIRSLSKRKLQLIKASTSLSGFTPDIYIYTESKYDSSQYNTIPHNNIYHSSHIEGQGGTTIITNKTLNIIEAGTSIPNTIYLTIQKGKAFTFIVGTYFHHRHPSRQQKLKSILEILYEKAKKYENSNILIFGDLNMKPNSVENIITSSTIAIALNLKVCTNYESPNSFPNLTTRVGTNKNNQKVFSQLDYIICNRSCKTNTSFNSFLSDHISFRTEMSIESSKIQKIPSYNRGKNIERNNSIKFN